MFNSSGRRSHFYRHFPFRAHVWLGRLIWHRIRALPIHDGVLAVSVDLRGRIPTAAAHRPVLVSSQKLRNLHFFRLLLNIDCFFFNLALLGSDSRHLFLIFYGIAGRHLLLALLSQSLGPLNLLFLLVCPFGGGGNRV